MQSFIFILNYDIAPKGQPSVESDAEMVKALEIYNQTAIDDANTPIGELNVLFNSWIPRYNYNMFIDLKYSIDISKELGNRIGNPIPSIYACYSNITIDSR